MKYQGPARSGLRSELDERPTGSEVHYNSKARYVQ